VNLAACFAASERATLLIDLDPQANASSAYGINTSGADSPRMIYDALMGDCVMKEAAQPTEPDCLHIVPSGQDLVGAEIELVSRANGVRCPEQALADVRDAYEIILIDCPPSLGILTLNALTASDSLLIPIQCEFYALEGLSQLLNTVRLVQRSLNPQLEIEGVLLTMFDGRLNLARQVAAEAREYFGDRVYKTAIPRNVRLAEAPSFGQPILRYDVLSNGAQSYLALAKELMAGPGATQA